jgi:spermidine synthase
LRTRTDREPEITLSEFDGVRYLHFASEWVQGAMRLARPVDLELEYVRQMMGWLLFLHPPGAIAQLGLGAGALTRFCHHHLPDSRLQVVECSRAVIHACRQWFRLPPDDGRLRVAHQDAHAFIRTAQAGTFGVIQSDLYDREARGPVIDSVAFYRDCQAALATPGILVVNLFGEHASYARNLARLHDVFDGRVIEFPRSPAGNVVVLAFKGPPLTVGANVLLERARVIARAYGLETLEWARAILSDQQALQV